ncbi:hypothetical protein ACIPM0_15810 [Pseudomonas sichuanensis]|uniref:hypothetical protein n=1 Tax=Pseudomonas sichuanensis TaxID=2213015 RepID=UPI00382F5602
MYYLISGLREDQSFDIPPTLVNMIFLLVGMVLLFSLVLALCMFEQFGSRMSFVVAAAVCVCALSVFFVMRKQAKVTV